MNTVQIKVKRLPGNEDISLPAYETLDASGMDIRAAVKEDLTLQPGEIRLVRTGLAVSIPPGYEGQIRPRSSAEIQAALSRLGEMSMNGHGDGIRAYLNEFLSEAQLSGPSA